MTMPTANEKSNTTRWLKRIVLGLLVYWAVYATVAPVTVWDAHTYNLARLMIAHERGLFDNPLWNSERQVAFPWTFDAVHYPFLFLGWGCAIPSFVCFLGLLVIVFRMVRTRYGEEAAWYCCLGLLSLPTLVFQAASTKNDLAMVFGVACWVYALWRYRAEHCRVLLFLGALGLALAAGAKSSGVPIFALLSIFTVWHLRSDRRAVVNFLVSTAVCIIGWGSVEIYLNNWRTFGNIVGPLSLRNVANAGGVQGLLANFIRYALGSVNIGLDVASRQSSFPSHLENLCRGILKLSGLENRGYGRGFSDATFRFLKNGWESGSDFGPVGTLSLIAATFLLLTRRVRDPLWLMAGAGFGSLLSICGMVAWMPWNMRFLLLPFVLFTVAATIFVVHDASWSGLGRKVFLGLSLYSAILFPLYSYNKAPRHIWLSLTDRDAMTTLERPTMLEILKDLRARKSELGASPMLIYASGDSWVLPLLQMNEVQTVSCPHLSPSIIEEIAKAAHTTRVYVLALNRDAPEDLALRRIRIFTEDKTSLFEWQAPQP
jgi:hypothetical protein